MHDESPLFKQITIIGVGLIGGSLGMAIKKYRLAKEVFGLSHRHTSLVYALKHHAIDRAFHDVRKAVVDADLVIMATPVNTIITLLPTIGRCVKRGCIVTDVGSTKIAIVECAEKNFNTAFFVGSHPMAGSEKKGVAFATPDLFANSLCLMTPNERTNKSAEEKLKTFWSRLGTQVKTLNPTDHDRILGYTSHLPHLIAYGLMNVIPDDYLPYAGQGLKDTTRIAASSPNMWNDICMTNSHNVVGALDSLIKNMAYLRKLIVAKDDSNLTEVFKKSKLKRDGLDPVAN